MNTLILALALLVPTQHRTGAIPPPEFLRQHSRQYTFPLQYHGRIIPPVNVMRQHFYYGYYPYGYNYYNEIKYVYPYPFLDPYYLQGSYGGF